MSAGGFRIRAGTSPHGPGRVEVTVESGAEVGRFHFESREVDLWPSSEAQIAGTLLLGMVHGGDLLIDAQVSKRFLRGVSELTEIYRGWQPTLTKVQVRGAAAVERAKREEGRVGLFFSAGVDSYHSLLRHHKEITDLVLIDGFEIPHKDHKLYEDVARLVHGVGEHFGIRVIEVVTDLRAFLVNRGVEMGRAGYGTMLACVAHLLASEFSRVYIAAAHTTTEDYQDGSHPALGALWSTEALEIIHDGGDATRTDKLRLIAEDEFALSTLRVCVKRPEHGLNCGRCEKCIRTMIGLLIVGALDRCPTFETGLDPRRIAQLSLVAEGKRSFTELNIADLERMGNQEELVRALRTALRRSERRMRLRSLLQRTTPAIRSLVKGAARAVRRVR